MSVDTVIVQNTGNALGELAFPNKETFKSKNDIASLDSNGKLLLAQAPYTAGTGIRISNLGVISATGGGGSGGSSDEHNKGWYATPDQLPKTGENGDYAIVGSTDTVWIWDGDTSSWVDSGAKGSVTKVNGKTGEVVLTAEDIETTESIVLVGDAGTKLEAAIATVAQNTANNSTLAGNTAVKTQFINATTSTHTTTIGGILDVINNDSTADIRINGQSLDTKFNTKQDKITAGDGIVLSDDNTISTKLLTVEGKSPNPDGNIDISAADVNAYTIEDVDARLATKQDSLTAEGNITITKAGSLTKISSPIYKAGTGINISDDFEITATGGVKGTVTSVNNQTPDDSGNVSLTTANIPNLNIGEDNRTITIGSKSVVPLTADSTIAANKVSGTVASAIKASQDGTGNVITTTYATKTSLDAKQDSSISIATITADTVVGALTELKNDISTNATVIATKASSTDLNAVKTDVTALKTTVGDSTSGLVKDVADNTIAISTINSSLSNKQNTLIAGDNITITDNTISAIDTTYTAGTNISITGADNTIAVTGLTKSSVGLDNVDNTSDANKPISTATQTALNLKQDKTDDTLATTAKTVVGAINELNTATGSKASQADLTALQNKVTNISTSDGKTIVTGTLEVVGASDTDIPTVDTGENGQVLTNTIVVSDEIDTAKIAMSGNKAVKIDAFDTSISASSTDTGLPTSKAVYTAINGVSTSVTNKANLDASNLSDANVTSWKEKLEIDVIEADLDTKQTKANIVTSFSTTTSDEKYPSEKLVYTSLSQVDQRITGIENDTNALSTSKQDKLTAGANIDISGTTISVKDLYTNTQIDGFLADKADKATTLAGYEINDAYTSTQTDTKIEEAVSEAQSTLQASIDTKVAKSDIATSISTSPVDTKVASEKAVYDAIDGLQNKVTSTVEVNVAPTTAKTATAITGALAKAARVVVVPKYTNIGAVYVKETTTYSAVNPIYPDPVNNVYEFTNMQNVKVFVDSLGDSVDLIIEYRG